MTMGPDPLRPSALGEVFSSLSATACCAERVWAVSHRPSCSSYIPYKISSPPPLQTIGFYGKMAKTTSRTNDRGCNHRKVAGEESPGFTGQDAG